MLCELQLKQHPPVQGYRLLDSFLSRGSCPSSGFRIWVRLKLTVKTFGVGYGLG